MTEMDTLIDRIKREVSCRELLTTHGALRGGEKGNVICPFHKENSPSLSLSEKDGIHLFNCFGCGAHGDVIGMEMRLSNTGFRDAVLALGKRFGFALPDLAPKPLPTPDGPRPTLIGSRLFDYRAPDGSVIMRKVRWAMSDGSKTFTQWRPASPEEIAENRIAIRPDGVEYKAAKTPEFRQYKDASKTPVPPLCVNTLEGYDVAFPYNAPLWYQHALSLLKAEGEKDAEALTFPGHVGTCSHCGAGTPWPAAQLKALVDGGHTEVTHFADCDFPGLLCLLRDLRDFAKAGFTRQSYVPLIGVTDPKTATRVDWAEKHGFDISDFLAGKSPQAAAATLETLIESAQEWSPALEKTLIATIHELCDRFPKAAKNLGAKEKCTPAFFAAPVSSAPLPNSLPPSLPAAAPLPAAKTPKTPPSPKTPLTGLRFSPSDSGNALRLLELCGDDIRWVAGDEASFWAIWEKTPAGGGYWRYPVQAEHILKYTKLVYEAIKDEAASLRPEVISAAKGCTTEEAQEQIGKAHAFALNCESKTRRTAMVELLKGEPIIHARVTDFDANKWILNCQNGIVCLRTGELRKARRDELCSKITNASYDPHKAPLIFLRVLGYSQHDNQARIDCIQRWFGYSATGDVGEEAFMVWHGPGGRNGKTKLSEAVSYALGTYSGAAPSDLLTAKDRSSVPTDIADLKGLRHVTISEPEEGTRLAQSKMKLLTGGDTIRARKMFRDFFSFTPSHKMTMLTNERPMVRGESAALWDRLILVPFSRTVPVEMRDKHLSDKLRDEADGLLTWIVHGALAWQAHGLGAEAFKQDTDEWKRDEDIFGDFISASLELTNGVRAKKADVFKAYKAWAEGEGNSCLPAQVVGRILGQRGFREVRGGGGTRYWDGVRIREIRIASEPEGFASSADFSPI